MVREVLIKEKIRNPKEGWNARMEYNALLL